MSRPKLSPRLPGEHVYEGMYLIDRFPASSLDKIKTFPYRDEDVFVVTYPKAGTTWVQEIVYLLMHDGDVAAARAKDISERFPFMEWHEPGDTPNVDKLAAQQGRRFIKSHLGSTFFQKALKNTQAKFIIVMRNVKDSLVSYYHFYKNNAELGSFKGTFNEYFELQKANKICHGDWFDFNLGWWVKRGNPNVYFVKFENLIRDLPTQVRGIAEFLGVPVSQELMDTVCDHVSFDSMKNNPSVNRQGNDRLTTFMRNGKVGDWKNYFSKEDLEYIDSVYEKKLQDTGLTFDFEL